VPGLQLSGDPEVGLYSKIGGQERQREVFFFFSMRIRACPKTMSRKFLKR
jgi:hypothetical protein